MNVAELPASKQWAGLKFKGQVVAEVWFQPDGEPAALALRIPRTSFHIPEVAPLLTAANLLLAVGVTADDVQSCASLPDEKDAKFDLACPLPTPPEGVEFLNLLVRVKPPEVPEAKWQDLESRWNAILILEASIDTLRIGMESLRTELEASSRRMLAPEEKVNALNADVAIWTKAKSRIVHALPKAREFIHRSTWAAGAPERKQLEELVKNYVRPRIAFPQLDKLAEQLENLLKDRQVLSAHGVSVYQDCKLVSAEVQGALRTLQNNAAANAAKKRGASAARGKFS